MSSVVFDIRCKIDCE